MYEGTVQPSGWVLVSAREAPDLRPREGAHGTHGHTAGTGNVAMVQRHSLPYIRSGASGLLPPEQVACLTLGCLVPLAETVCTAAATIKQVILRVR